MLNVINALQKVETGEYKGVGSQMVALGSEVNTPQGLERPPRDNGLGFVSRYLASTALDMVQDTNLGLTSPVENGKVVDKRLLAWLLIGRQQGTSGLDSEQFVFAAENIISRAFRVTTAISQLKIVQGGKKTATNWRSMFEGTVKAGIFGDGFEPTIVTSLGGNDGPVPLAAPFNILPGLEVAQALRDAGFNPRLIVTSAAKYGVDCNGLVKDAAIKNWDRTLLAYQRLMQEYYPEAADRTSYETLWPRGLEAYPEQLVDAARYCCDDDESLRLTAEQYGANADAFVKYMLSHTQAFRDYQIEPESPFVIKVGAPSELRFSRWQKRLIERAMDSINGYVPNMAMSTKNSGSEYGQISLYYPRIGIRPPYYPDDPTEPSVDQDYPPTFEDFLWSIPDDSPALRRYADLEAALGGARIKPDEYLTLFRGALK